MNNEIIRILINVVPPIVGAVIGFLGVIAGIEFKNRKNRKKQEEKIIFNIYMKLLNLRALYFWVSSAEMTKHKIDSDIFYKAKDLSWRIIDELRKIDNRSIIKDILDLLMLNDLDKYPSADARLKKLKKH